MEASGSARSSAGDSHRALEFSMGKEKGGLSKVFLTAPF